MKKLITISLRISFIFIIVLSLYPCFSIVVGKDASYNGAVLFAHNEDDSGNDILRLWKVEARTYNEEFPLLYGGKERTAKAYSFLWIELKNQLVADTYVNEYGVAVASDACPSKIETKEEGIIYFLRRLVIERAKTAREGILIAGELIKKHGYPGGRTLIIVDPKEGWFLHILGGKHWLAWRVPDDAVATIPNFYTLKRVDLIDTSRFLASEDIIRLAIKKGLYNPERDGEFDFAKVFSNEFAYSTSRNVYRQWRAMELLSGKKYPRKPGLPHYFKSPKKISPNDLFRVLRDHYEGTDLYKVKNPERFSPHRMKARTICTYTTKYSFVLELRRKLPSSIGILMWFSPSRPGESPYIPIYFGVKNFGDEFVDREPQTHAEVLARHFNLSLNEILGIGNFFFYPFRALTDEVEKHYLEKISKVRNEWRKLEDYYWSVRPYVEESALKIYKEEGKEKAEEYLTNFVTGAMYMARRRALHLISSISRSEVNKKRCN